MDEEEWYEDEPQPVVLGTVHQLIQLDHKRRVKVKRRPIGFLANIDELIEDDSL